MNLDERTVKKRRTEKKYEKPTLQMDEIIFDSKTISRVECPTRDFDEQKMEEERYIDHNVRIRDLVFMMIREILRDSKAKKECEKSRNDTRKMGKIGELTKRNSFLSKEVKDFVSDEVARKIWLLPTMISVTQIQENRMNIIGIDWNNMKSMLNYFRTIDVLIGELEFCQRSVQIRNTTTFLIDHGS